MSASVLGWLVLGLPLLGAIILSLWPSEPSKAITRLVGCGSMLLAFVLTLATWGTLLGEGAEERTHVSALWRWIEIGNLKVDLSIRIDQLSVLMMLVITGVGFLIHLYSTEYMLHDGGYRRFFAQMNFFVFSMLLLVEAANFVFLIVGWALVGLASYLLIGFYDDRPSAVAAARKAFVINVIGDVGLVLAAFILLAQTGTLDFDAVFASAPTTLNGYTAEAVGLLLFVGAAAKSAQVPLHTWLPDAMEGPTPVSALIHAATMVTAGVYLIVRCHVLYELAPSASNVVAIVGGVTLLLAATIACVQVDIKRVLAWSTVSQIGYMIMAAGLHAYSSSMFHFLTHAFFKALLFLGAGIVIHALHGEQSLDKMGGLGKHLRGVMLMMAVGCMAIAGVPGLSGFFSKDAILAHAWNAGALGKGLWVVGIVAAALTAFYMFRLFFRTFLGPDREGGYEHLHMPGWAMTAPVAILTVGAAVGGWIEIPGVWEAMTTWLDPVVAGGPLGPAEVTHSAEWITGIASTLVALLGIGVAWKIFGQGPARRLELAGVARGPRSVLQDGYRFDDIFEGTVTLPTKQIGEVFLTKVEPRGAQGLVDGASGAVTWISGVISRVEGGLVRGYAAAMVGGVAVLGLVAVVLLRGN
jgi:NADH-quinone oxidoreductase subunit L